MHEIASVVLLRADGAALLQHRDDKPGLPLANRWVPPGGHCEAGEPIEMCARREFLEETGCRLTELHQLTRFLDDNVPGHAATWVTVFWSVWDGAQQPVCLEGQALEFVPRSRAAAMQVPGYLVRIWDSALAAASIDVIATGAV